MTCFITWGSIFPLNMSNSRPLIFIPKYIHFLAFFRIFYIIEITKSLFSTLKGKLLPHRIEEVKSKLAHKQELSLTVRL